MSHLQLFQVDAFTDKVFGGNPAAVYPLENWLDDETLQAIAQEIVRADALERVHIGLDFFDASINRIAAWTIGTRNTLKALLAALLEPTETLQEYEAEGDYTSRLALQEALKSMPMSAVWDYYCVQKEVPVGIAFMDVIKNYEKKELAERM